MEKYLNPKLAAELDFSILKKRQKLNENTFFETI